MEVIDDATATLNWVHEYARAQHTVANRSISSPTDAVTRLVSGVKLLGMQNFLMLFLNLTGPFSCRTFPRNGDRERVAGGARITRRNVVGEDRLVMRRICERRDSSFDAFFGWQRSKDVGQYGI